jgi:hypothetical protein
MTVRRQSKTKHSLDIPAEYRKKLVQDRKVEVERPVDDELVLKAEKGLNDFKYFCEELLGMRVHPGQLDVVSLMSVPDQDYGCLAAANGWGKTLFYAMLVMWASFYRKWAPAYWREYKAVVMGPELAQALITHNEIEQIRQNRHAGQFWRKETGGDDQQHNCLISQYLIPFTTKNKHTAFTWSHNNSKIHFESAKEKASSIEGWALNLIVFDEVRLELHLKDIVEDVFLARATRAAGMKILLGSTPLQDSFDFMEYCDRGMRGGEGWWFRSGGIDENIFLDHEYIKKLRAKLDPRVVEQILAGKFVEAPDSYFVRNRILNCFIGEAPVIFGEFKGLAKSNRTYVGGVDTAVSETGDYSVVTIWDITGERDKAAQVVYEFEFPRGTSTTKVVEFCDELIKEFGCQIGYDAQGPLGVEFSLNVSQDSGWYLPIRTGGNSINGISVPKSDALANFRYLVNNDLWKSPNLPQLKHEMIAYKFPKDERLRKDHLMAQVYAAWTAKDYLGINVGGLKFNPMENPYGGEKGPFSTRTDDKPMSSMRREWLQWVDRSKQIEQNEKSVRETLDAK